MSKPVILVEKSLDNNNFAQFLENRFNILRQTFDQKVTEADRNPVAVVINVHLENSGNVEKIRRYLRQFPDAPRIFLVNDPGHPSTKTANQLKADRILRRPYGLYDDIRESSELRELEEWIAKYIDRSVKKLWTGLPERDRAALHEINAVNNEIMEAILEGDKIPREKVSSCCDQLIASIEGNKIGEWLEAVKTHHSYTHRHSITVTGLAIAFGMHIKLPRGELKRFATGALMHDIGKIKIPLHILDKPGKLTMEEMELIKTHPVQSAEILQQDGQFDASIIELALHHHELLDGSGYPDGLKGNEIPDITRMLTIIDIFSALVDQRAYKKSMSGREALDMMEKMEGMLDVQLLRAFRPIGDKVPDEADFPLSV